MPITISGDGAITGLVAGGLPDNSITADEIADGVITRSKVSTSESDSFAFCRAWVNFNGTGTVAIRADFNVSSITDNGTGDYTVNFTNAMPDANYTFTQGLSRNQNAAFITRVGSLIGGADTTYSTTACRLIAKWTDASANASEDPLRVNIAFFR